MKNKNIYMILGGIVILGTVFYFYNKNKNKKTDASTDKADDKADDKTDDKTDDKEDGKTDVKTDVKTDGKITEKDPKVQSKLKAAFTKITKSCGKKPRTKKNKKSYNDCLNKLKESKSPFDSHYSFDNYSYFDVQAENVVNLNQFDDDYNDFDGDNRKKRRYKQQGF
jgi:hypothetical protein